MAALNMGSPRTNMRRDSPVRSRQALICVKPALGDQEAAGSRVTVAAAWRMRG